MERKNLILPECLQGDLAEKLDLDVKKFAEDIYNTVKDDFEKFRRASMKSRIDAQKYALD